MDVNALVSQMSNFVWNTILMWVLVGTGLIYSFRTGFVQVRHFGRAMKRVFGDLNLNGEKAGSEGMSSFQALATAIAAQVGTGNIAGCATALISGGPGAIFWMWLAAFFGMSTIYGEACLAQKTKTRDEDGAVIGGPVYYIRLAFKGTFGKFLAGFFAVAIILALAAWATWCSPTPSARPSTTPSASPCGWSASPWQPWPASSSSAAWSASPPLRRRSCPSWPPFTSWVPSSC
jgi:AGCS family alanine or glycine:cation symporter